MSRPISFREWLLWLRLRRDVCQMIPVESVFGCPIEVDNGKEYIIPVYNTFASQTDYCIPFSYIRASYPNGSIMTFSRLFFESTNTESKITENVSTVIPPEDYYSYLDQRIRSGDETNNPDLVLRAFLDKHRPQMRMYYEALFLERDKYRLKEANYLHENN